MALTFPDLETNSPPNPHLVLDAEAGNRTHTPRREPDFEVSRRESVWLRQRIALGGLLLGLAFMQLERRTTTAFFSRRREVASRPEVLHRWQA